MSHSGEQRWRQRFDNFGKALAQLSEACQRAKLSNPERAGLIKICELCFELSWSVLKDFLACDGYEEETPRAVIRKSFEAGHINEKDCETLLRVLDKRNLLSRAYRDEIAREAEILIKDDFHPALLRLPEPWTPGSGKRHETSPGTIPARGRTRNMA